jgi:biopolymer transport protein ExbB/TolQ
VFKGITEKAISDFMNKIYKSLNTEDMNAAITECKNNTIDWLSMKIKIPISSSINYILEHSRDENSELENGAYTQLDKELAKMEKGLGILSTLGSISPFIGLFGTVVGIIKSFNALSLNNTSNYTSVMSGIADALVATAAGLVVAVPAVMFYNYFIKRLKQSLPLYDEAIQNTIKQLKIIDMSKKHEAV